jgi:type 1 glutamine amidotransferase
VLHPAGVIATRFGVVTGQGTPTTEQRQAFIDALDTMDVAVFLNNVEIGNIISDPVHRAKFEAFSRSKGVVSIHHTTDSYGTWPAWDSLHGTRFRNHPSSDREATLHLDTLAHKDPHWKFLNRGLPDTVRILEEWFSFLGSAETIRAVSALKVTVRVDESSYSGGMGGAFSMGPDHPMSWYRALPEGGRFFYTAMGHRPQTYLDNGGNPSTPFLRRQIYNAILWTAGYNEDGTRIRAAEIAGKFSGAARVAFSGDATTVSLLRDGSHAVEILGLDGRRIAFQRGAGRAEHRFENLQSGVHFVVVTTPDGRHARRVVIP